MQPRRDAVGRRPRILITSDGAVECRLLGPAAEANPGSDARPLAAPAPDFGFVKALQDALQSRRAAKPAQRQILRSSAWRDLRRLRPPCRSPVAQAWPSRRQHVVDQVAQACAVVPLHKLGHLDGNMSSIKSLKLVCQACGSKNWKATLFARQHEVEAFAAGP
jgi:hypothetical protein